MDPRLLSLYERELKHLRGTAAEFAKDYPKIAGRLGLDEFDCVDPYVERLLEGFAFLAARVQLKLEAEFPRFTQQLLELVYPHYLGPTPSMAVVQLEPDMTEGSLAGGVKVPRDTVLRSIPGPTETTPCEFRTAHEVTLWPLRLTTAEYLGNVATLKLPETRTRAVAAIRLRFQTAGGIPFENLPLDALPLHLVGSDDLPMRISEQLQSNCIGVVVQEPGRDPEWQELVEQNRGGTGSGAIGRRGFSDEEALLPYGPRSFHGYRLLHEYFAFPQRFMFVELRQLQAGVRRIPGTEMELIILLDRVDEKLEQMLRPTDFRLFCTPAINLFPKRTDRITVTHFSHEYHILPDRTRPLDFEVHHLTRVTGHGAGPELRWDFLPFYSRGEAVGAADEQTAYYTLRREPRRLSSTARRNGHRSSYVGSETYVSIVDASQPPYPGDLHELSLMAMCTNRDLPLLMSVGQGRTDFTLESGEPVESARCLSGPTTPRPSLGEGEAAWRFLSHLSLNYLSLIDDSSAEGAQALRDLLSLYVGHEDRTTQRQILGLRSARTRPVTRRIMPPREPGVNSANAPAFFGRGLEIEITLDEEAYEGMGVFLIGAVLEDFFTRYVSINSFTETSIRTLTRGEIMRWPPRIGRRHSI